MGLLLGAALGLVAQAAQAQYFGRNKVRYETFQFEILNTHHFDIHYYPEEEIAAQDVARMADRWYTRLSDVLAHQYGGTKPIVLYADDTDFQQTNVIRGYLGEGTGGVTESFKNRVVMPITGSYAETNHVLGHELVHVFQYDIAQRMEGRTQGLGSLPLWFIEGMAEYLSVGPISAQTAMWLRDSILNDDLPSARDLSVNPRYFPYRFGHGLWSYIAGRWGDGVVGKIYISAVRAGIGTSIKSHLRMSLKELVEAWHVELKATYEPLMAARKATGKTGRVVIESGKDEKSTNVAPSPSPDGRYVAFLSARDLFGIDLYLADANSGKIIKRISSASSDPHIRSLKFIESSGTWSPDGSQFAFVVYSEGTNNLAIVDVEKRDIIRQIRVSGVDALSNPAWSPKGDKIAVSGITSAASDLFLIDVASGDVEQLTNDRFADLQPSWSPDATTLLFVTDRGGRTNFDTLEFAEMGIGMVSLRDRRINVLRPFPFATHSDPEFSPDRGSIFFRSDQNGFFDLYRFELESTRVFRLTSLPTGVSGIARLSPSMGVAQQTGEIFFNVFHKGGYAIHALTTEQTQGQPANEEQAIAALLPPFERDQDDRVVSYLGDAQTGLPFSETFPSTEYDSSLSLDYVGNTGVGVSFDNRYGAAVGGGVSAWFSDMLGHRNLGMALYSNGGFKDLGAQVLFQNLEKRWSWSVGASHIPYLSFRTSVRPTVAVINGTTVAADEFLQEVRRVFEERVSGTVSYPISETRRLEFLLGGAYYSFDTELERFLVAGGQVFDGGTEDLPSQPGLGLIEPGIAIVGDSSFGGFTSPIKGSRFRLEYSPVFGTLQYHTVLADARQYFLKRPASLGFRALHYGRYGKGADDDRLSTLFIGYPTLIRGYDVDTIDFTECGDGNDDCPVFDRLVGSKIAVANAEARVQILGVDQFGLVSFPYVPTELVFFFDAGLAWTEDEEPFLAWRTDNNAGRIPVFSAGVSLRVAPFGVLPLEFFWAKPFQRPDQNVVFGFQIAPGW